MKTKQRYFGCRDCGYVYPKSESMRPNGKFCDFECMVYVKKNRLSKGPGNDWYNSKASNESVACMKGRYEHSLAESPKKPKQAYQCKSCGHLWNSSRPLSTSHPKKCPNCQKKTNFSR